MKKGKIKCGFKEHKYKEKKEKVSSQDMLSYMNKDDKLLCLYLELLMK